MKSEELIKQYRNMLMFLEGCQHKKSSNSDILHPIIASLEEKIEELNSLSGVELSDVEYSFYIDMLDMYCRELSDSGIECNFDIFNNKKSNASKHLNGNTHLKRKHRRKKHVESSEKKEKKFFSHFKIEQPKDEIPEKKGDATKQKKSNGLLGYIVLFVLVLSFVIIGKNGYEKYKLISDAESGIPKAQYELACNYRFAENGFEHDSNKADKWMKAAANNGYAPAQHNMGLLYEQSWRRTHVGFDVVVSWYTKAAEQGYRSSIEKLEELQNEFPALFQQKND